MMFTRLIGLGITSLGLSGCAFGQDGSSTDNDDAVSVFTTSLDNRTGGYVFALNIPSDSDDIYFHLSGPSEYSWIAVGTGSQMRDSLMFIAYLNSTGNGVTFSPRLSTGETEPTYSSTIDVETLSGTGLSNDSIVVKGRCSNCQKWSTGSLDLNSTNQAFIYALGPSSGAMVKLKSNSISANLERHSVYGTFTIDVTQATGGTNGSSILSDSLTSDTTSTGTSAEGNQTHDSNWPSIIHGLALSAAFIILMPTGAVFLRIMPASVRWHWINQTLATILVGIGGVLGLWLSTMYNKSKGYNSTHQILGIVCIIAVFVQWFLGFWHHLQYKRSQTPTRFGVVHVYLGRVILLLGIAVGAMGLVWSAVITRIVIIYVAVADVIVFGVIGLVVWKKRSSSSTFKRLREPLDSEGSISNVDLPARGNRYI